MKVPYPKHHFVKTGHIPRCQVCNSSKLHIILDLGHQPLCDTLLTKEMLNGPEKTYPLRMIWCSHCTGVQIDYCVDGKEVYHPDYPYRSGISKPLADYQRQICLSLIEKYGLNSKDLAIDIGSNDGTLLSGFKREGIRILGVEPTNIAKYANAHGIRTIQSFFDIKASQKIKKKYGPAAVITTTNVFAHMQTIGEVIMGIYNLLEDDGVFISETHYLLNVIQGGQFDTIYHEHLRTYSLRSLIALFAPYDFTVTDVERGDRYGGNIRVHVTKGRGRRVSPRVAKLLKEERAAGLDKLATYGKFARRVKKARLEFMDFLIKTKKSGKSIVGKSCPGRASTLLNYYGVDTEYIPYLAELPTSLKLGMYLPGKHIPVVNEKILLKEQPDYVVLLSWHYAEVIMKRLKAAGLKSDFVIPLPDLRIVKNSRVKRA
ncbi:methyltransferase [Candidatus Kaiserbacteria bacterium RIFCSPLOWO2_01_FULL_54_20]|uniref:Methyltransferase n=1 Tax=Candidatus Kaiserbacteria bacterium RIFCSPLOWO2_01_FULL_54_20 TaxID=1798513 RepID=A0A1F6EKK2_9BACT|nr:MAG: methyltransferase [Candidatus Kaiserbacteria bacterium RIFCSPLOWO2_01_FULL_54_20]